MVQGREGPEKGGPGRGGPGKAGEGGVLGMSGEGEVQGGGSRKGSTDRRRKLAKRFWFFWFRIHVFWVYGLVNKLDTNASVCHSVRLEKSPRLEKKRSSLGKNDKSWKQNVGGWNETFGFNRRKKTLEVGKKRLALLFTRH